MKYLSLLLLLCCGQVVAQKKDSSIFRMTAGPTVISFIGYREGKTQVGHDPQGNLMVKGDSASAIKLLFKMIDAGAKREDDHWRCIAQYEKQLATIRRMLNELKKANTVK